MVMDEVVSAASLTHQLRELRPALFPVIGMLTLKPNDVSLTLCALAEPSNYRLSPRAQPALMGLFFVTQNAPLFLPR